MEIYDLDKERVDAAIKEAWQGLRVLQGNPTIDVLRYEVTGESDVLVDEGDKTLVPGLSSLEACVFPKVRKRKVVRGLIEYQEADIVFVLYDTDVLLTDLIQFNNKKYQVLQSNYNESSGRCVVTASKV